MPEHPDRHARDLASLSFRNQVLQALDHLVLAPSCTQPD
jgi:hypothetical protein